VLLFNREKIDVLTDPYQPDPYKHKALGAAALKWVLKRGIHLASLQLPSYYGINPAEQQSIRDTIASLALNGRLDKLETISFNECSYIKDAEQPFSRSVKDRRRASKFDTVALLRARLRTSSAA
jgi:hypothetical protein